MSLKYEPALEPLHISVRLRMVAPEVVRAFPDRTPPKTRIPTSVARGSKRSYQDDASMDNPRKD